MSNNISMICRLGGDAELKAVGSTELLEFNVVNETGFGDKKISSWYRAKIWGKKATSLHDHLTKGKQIVVYGELSLRKYTDKDGVEKMSPEVNVSNLDFCGDKQGGGSAPAPAPAPSAPTTAETEDNMPF